MTFGINTRRRRTYFNYEKSTHTLTLHITHGKNCAVVVDDDSGQLSSYPHIINGLQTTPFPPSRYEYDIGSNPCERLSAETGRELIVF